MSSRVALATFLVLAASYAIAAYLRKRDNEKSRSPSKGSSAGLSLFKGSPRLPTFASPKHYDLELDLPDLNASKFDGKVSISLDILEETRYLVLNIFDLSFKEKTIWLRCNGTREILWPSIEIDRDDEILVLTFDQCLPVGEAILTLDFEGKLADGMKGLYRSSYMNNGEKRYMAVTQFEPVDARRCFPCWDEPSFKATFKMTVNVPKDRVALSNMPVESENVVGNTKRVSFEVSPKMSTYLVALVVGELEYLESEMPSGKKVRVYCESGKTEQGKFSLDIATRILPFYEEYFGTPYPLPKLDMVAIPDFAAGAMENYGLVTYRESALLYDEKNSAAKNKQRVAVVVAHELAHQWFGNLVTMEWWTHLWLNEGFATWVSFLAVDDLFPDWKIWNQFIDTTVSAFRLDGLTESHPIEVEIRHAKEVDEIFDAISYNKGASIIRMLQSYLGAEVFQKGLMVYIKKYAYKNASTGDLWSSLSEVSGEPVEELMDSWTKQKGYPVLTVNIKDSNLVIEQSQYLSSGIPGNGEWVVPITVCVGSYSLISRALVRGKVDTLPLLTPPNEDGLDFQELYKRPLSTWIKLNVGQSSFYRVQYESELFSRLIAAIASGVLDSVDRFGILDDTYALSSSCKQPSSVLLSLMHSFKKETDFTVLGSLINIAYKITLVISDAIPEMAPQIKKLNGKILQYATEQLGWDAQQGESHLDAMLRGDLLGALISFEDEEITKEAVRRFEVFVQDRATPLLPADIRSAAFKAVMRKTTSSDRTGYDSLLQVYKDTNLSQEKSRILGSLASSPDPVMVKEALDFAVSSEVRNQDTMFVFSGISTEGREIAWAWLKENWSFVAKKWEGFLVSQFITTTTSQFTSDERAAEIEAFFKAHGNPAIERTVKQSIERVRINAQWVKHVAAEAGFSNFILQLLSKD